MSYNRVDRSLFVIQNKPLDAKLGPWASTAEAIAAIGINRRHQGLIVEVIESGSIVEYWWKDGIEDGDLVSKSSGGTGTVTSVGTTGLISGGPITTTGTITTSMSTNKLVGRSSAGTGIMEQITVGSGLTLSGGTLTNTATPTPTGYYGAWQDNNTQTAASSNTGYAMIFRTIDLSNGISVVTNGTNLTRITFDNTGIYNLQFSSQFQNTSNQLQDVTIWLRKNGTDLPGSSGYISVPNSHGGTPGHGISSWNYLLDVVAGEYYELIWSTTDHTSVTMQFYSAGSPPPSAASVILTVTQQSGIMAGTGITAINSLTGAAQTIITGTTGTDIAISSAGTTHTLNIPTASSSNRGALSSTDWSTFNNKQNTITGAASTITTSNLTASRVLVSDSSGKVAANTVTTTTLGYLDATSSIQTQLNGKQATLTNPVTGTGTNNEIAAFNSTGSTITSLSTTTYPSLTELSYVKGLTSAIQTQINALPRVVYTNYTAETTTSTTTTNALTTFTLTISDANWPLGGVLRLNGLLERTAGSGSIFMGLVCNGSTARYFSSAGQNMQWEWQIMKEASNTLRIGMGPSNTGSGSYAVHNNSTVTATASGGNYVFTFYMFVGTAGATASMRWMKGIMIP